MWLHVTTVVAARGAIEAERCHVTVFITRHCGYLVGFCDLSHLKHRLAVSLFDGCIRLVVWNTKKNWLNSKSGLILSESSLGISGSESQQALVPRVLGTQVHINFNGLRERKAKLPCSRAPLLPFQGFTGSISQNSRKPPCELFGLQGAKLSK